MRAWTSCSALLLAILLPAAASAQPVARNGGFYGNTYVAPDYDYPYARTEDGYAEGYPLVTRPASRAYQGQRVAGYPYDVTHHGQRRDPAAGLRHGLRQQHRLCDLAGVPAPDRGLSRH